MRKNPDRGRDSAVSAGQQRHLRGNSAIRGFRLEKGAIEVIRKKL